MTLSLENRFQFVAFYVLGIFVVRTWDVGVISIFVVIVVLTLIYAKLPNEKALFFFISFLFLYPNIASNITVYNSKYSLLALCCVSFYALYRKRCNQYLRKNRTAKNILLFWFAWGSFTYSIVFIGYLLFEMYGYNIMELFDFPPPHTSNIEKYIKTIPTVFLTFVPVVSMGKKESFRRLFGLYLALLAINSFISLIQYKFGFSIIREEYSLGFRESIYGEKRAYSFSYADPLGFGRMISFPILLLVVFFVVRQRKAWNYRLFSFLAFFLGISALILTFSRTTYISTFIGLCAALLLFKKKLGSVLKMVFPFLVISSLVVFLNIPGFFSSIPRLMNPQGSLEARFFKHEIAYNLIKMNPLFGGFPGQMIYLSKTEGFHEAFASAHSLYLQTGVDYGVPMMVCIVLVLIYSFWTGFGLLREFGSPLSLKENLYVHIFLVVCTAHTISLMIHGIVETIGYSFIFLNLGYILAAKNILLQTEKRRQQIF